jgi:hypothetical protein
VDKPGEPINGPTEPIHTPPLIPATAPARHIRAHPRRIWWWPLGSGLVLTGSSSSLPDLVVAATMCFMRPPAVRWRREGEGDRATESRHC